MSGDNAYENSRDIYRRKKLPIYREAGGNVACWWRYRMKSERVRRQYARNNGTRMPRN